jgi:hypothetical protein
VTIVEFLTARFDEDEAVARAALHTPESDDWSWSDVDYHSGVAEDHGLRWKPERVLADIAAKRAIVERHAPYDDIHVRRQTRTLAGDTLRLLVQPYAEHPDIDPAWRTP